MKAEPRLRLPPGQRLARGWPVLHYGPIPSFDPNTWNFRVWGEVARPALLTYAEFRSLPSVKVVADFHCVTKLSVLDNEWEGVSFRSIAGSWRSSPPPASEWSTASTGTRPTCR